jgi:hypothetical protein
MKKSLLLLTGSLLSLGVIAQNQPLLPVISGEAVLKQKDYKVGNEPIPALPSNSRATNVSPNGTVIGNTTYDLQTNSSSQNRLLLHSDGTVSAVWTFSNNGTLAAPDRGTGYNYFDGTSWQVPEADLANMTRIESERGGWPSLLTINGGEVNTLHNTESSVITLNKRPAKGTGSWSESNVSGTDLIWNRTASGGPNGNTIHMIAVTAPTANNGQVFQGLDGALVYYRSLDGGDTWDIQDSVLPGLDASEFTGFSGDGYAITAKGNTVAFVYFGEWADIVMMKSTDNGDTWTKTIINEFPIDLWDDSQISDIDGDGEADILLTSDGAGSIVLDDEDSAHVFFGLMGVLEDDPLTDGSSFFPFTNGLMYWNESFGTGATSDTIITMTAQVIAQAEDLNDDGDVRNPNEDASTTAGYFVSLAGTPSAVYDENTDRIFVAYQSYIEESLFAQSFRHIYVTNTSDGGDTWSTPIDFTDNGIGVEECVFPSVANAVDDSLRIIYQEDNEPGLAVRGDEDPYGNNNIVYLAIPLTEIPGSFSNEVTVSNPNGETCDGDDITLTASSAGPTIEYLWSNGATTQEITLNATAQSGTYLVTVTNTANSNQVGSDPVVITIHPAPSAPTINENPNAIYEAVSSSAVAYQWYVDGSAVNGATSSTYDGSGNAGDEISVEITDANGCKATSQTVTGIDSHPVLGSIAIFPNPASDVVNVSFDQTQAGTYTIELLNAMGQLVISEQVSVDNTQRVEIETNTISTGIYQVRITNGSDQLVKTLMIK